jgi:hypothetical protein
MAYLVEALRLQAGRSRFRFPMGSLEFFTFLILWIWVQLSLNINWGKGGRCLWLTTLPPSCADCLEILGASSSWSQEACNGIALHNTYGNKALLTQKHSGLRLRPHKVSKPASSHSSSPRFHNHCNQALHRLVFAAWPITAWPTLHLTLSALCRSPRVGEV